MVGKGNPGGPGTGNPYHDTETGQFAKSDVPKDEDQQQPKPDEKRALTDEELQAIEEFKQRANEVNNKLRVEVDKGGYDYVNFEKGEKVRTTKGGMTPAEADKIKAQMQIALASIPKDHFDALAEMGVKVRARDRVNLRDYDRESPDYEVLGILDSSGDNINLDVARVAKGRVRLDVTGTTVHELGHAVDKVSDLNGWGRPSQKLHDTFLQDFNSLTSEEQWRASHYQTPKELFAEVYRAAHQPSWVTPFKAADVPLEARPILGTKYKANVLGDLKPPFQLDTLARAREAFAPSIKALLDWEANNTIREPQDESL